MVINHYNYWPLAPLLDDANIFQVENYIMSSFEVPREILRGDVVDAVVRSHALRADASKSQIKRAMDLFRRGL